ncbi:MAG TPA: hypothetical protein DCQ26_15570 [Marinilabiliales bacterium]|nr:MAG: hypothetical protein A2W95_14495 [Bacteroidetes bacterium GWA2_40_14]OFX71541.1 MAG: hypothetical protein A2W96_10350 [Bacteroidetes bacterium GWD2_40_43]OFX95575.1 MAG: hypothetical protein A2W97_00670 [Bacteroidetes bacterium GWE2_40_63]OFY22267.1 MAG: hypothetical protein A2W88_07055 [Bacteroidetes bacterium GWF2_40_13]OFZ24903.1 MAG: hypothetical protein A2437_14690 [Bacteroidetes bacterium RIFOXYC2_FULL_40_12]HAN00019.1 hypothetical protein [Marinilabiliales bacterium]
MKNFARLAVYFSIITGSALLVSLVDGCTFQNEEDYFGETYCDTIDVSYEDLTYIFTDICAECHNSTETKREGINMDSYTNVKASINTELVLPAIKHETSKMPKGRDKLSTCDISKIEAWVNAGMPEISEN